MRQHQARANAGVCATVVGMRVTDGSGPDVGPVRRGHDPLAIQARSVVIDLELQYGQALFGFVRRLGLDDSQADDAVQEVLVRLWRELVKGAPIDRPREWAFRTIYRVAMDEHRVQRRITNLRTLLSRNERAQGTADVDQRVTVWAEVDRLPMRQRQVLYLRYRADMAFDEVAEVLGITSSAARSHATQAFAVMRRRLADRQEFR
jgi:RNA polymerase sigma factor (sigma-70 family)